MRRLICISKGCFWSPYLKEDLNKDINLIPKLDVDGFEFLLGDVMDLLTFRFKKSSLKILRGYKFNTVHAPFHLDGEYFTLSNNKRSKRIMKKLYEIYDKINAVNINMHPQQIKNFKIFDTKNYQHSIESMELKEGFSIQDYNKILKKNPSFRFVLDTTHALEGQELGKLLKTFKKKIIYAHLSAAYLHHLHLPLHVLKEEYLKPLNIIKKSKFPVILENFMGAKGIEEYKKEVNFVRKWLNS